MDQPLHPPMNLAGAVALIESLRDQLKLVRRSFDDDSQATAQAIERADAFVQGFSEALSEEIASTSIVGPLDSQRYGHAKRGRGPDFEMAVYDRRHARGHVEIEMRPDGGHTDDILSVVAEIAPHPLNGYDVQALRVHNAGRLVASIFVSGIDQVLLQASKSAQSAGELRVVEGL